MNFLAHLHLSAGTPASMLGGIVADFMRAPDFAILPPDVQEGVRLHRSIDGFTNRHPRVLASVRRVSERFGWFAGIVIDIYYDHILARDWPRYSAEPLAAFAARAYAALEAVFPVATEEGKQFIRRLIDNNFLAGYATRDGIAETLARVSDRIARRIPSRAMRLEDGMPELVAADAELAADFHAFYPELNAFADRCKRGG